MGSTIVTLETHDYEICEIGNAGLTHPHLTGDLAGMARHLEDDWLLFHEIILLKGFSKVYFGPYPLSIDLRHLLLGILFAVAHGDEFL